MIVPNWFHTREAVVLTLLKTRFSAQILKATLSTLYYSGVYEIAAPFTRGEGVIFMLHRVTPEPVQPFEPNRILKVTPEFLDKVIRLVVEAGFDLLSIDEVPERLARGGGERPFAVFTLDDGYRDNLHYALPVFRRYSAPFTVYLPTDYMDGKGDLWWLMLERVIANSERVSVRKDGCEHHYDTATIASKKTAHSQIYWWLRSLPEKEARKVVGELAAARGYDSDALCRELIMNWDEVRTLAADPLVTIGAHTLGHYAVAKLDRASAHHEMKASIARIEQELNRPCQHFSYPYGCANSAGERDFELARELGLKTAVTTRKGQIDAGHRESLTQLPRFSLNGDYQDLRHIKVLLSGLPFRLWNKLSRSRVPEADATI